MPASLGYLWIADNHITDLAPLADHTKLKAVMATGNDISSLASIAEAPWVLAHCAYIRIEDNPLDAETLATIIPAMCEVDTDLQWDGGSCMGACPG